MSINPDCPPGGSYEALEGIYHDHGQQKLGVGKNEEVIELSLTINHYSGKYLIFLDPFSDKS